MKDRTAAKNRGKALTLSLLKRQNAQRLEQIDRQIATVEAAILQIIEANVSLADRFAILTSVRSLIHSRRSRRRPPSALHAGPRRRPLQSGHEDEIRTPHPNRKAGKGRPNRNHAKARRPRKCPPKGKSPLDAKNRLINTDTLAFRRSGRRLLLVTGRGLPDLVRVFPRIDLFDRAAWRGVAL